MVTKVNYSFEKRQRELAKKKKKEEKAQRKAQGPQPSEPPSDEGSTTNEASTGEGAGGDKA